MADGSNKQQRPRVQTVSSSPETRYFWTRRGWMRVAASLAARGLYGEELPRLEPPGEAAMDPALLNLLTRLRGIVAARKHLALEALMAATFRPEFDVAKGAAGFQQHWQPQSASSPIW